MGDPTVDYAALAKQHGGEAAASPDYAALAQKYGGQPLIPPSPAPAPPAPHPLSALAARYGGTPAEQAEEKMSQGAVEGWMPQRNREFAGANPVFRPGDPPALNTPLLHPPIAPAPPATIPPQQEADMPPMPVAHPAGPADMSTVPGAVPGMQTPEQAAGVHTGLGPTPAEEKAQGAREGWMPGTAEQKPFQPLIDLANRPLPEPTDLIPGLKERQEKQVQEFTEKHPVLGGIARGFHDVGEGMRTPANLALLAALPESKVISAFFAAQAAHGAYKNAEDAYQSFRQGKNPEAAQYATEAGLNALFAGLAGYHAAGAHATTAPETLHPAENLTAAPEAKTPTELTERPSEAKAAPSDAPRGTIGQTEPETDRPILHQSPHPEVNQAAATAEHPIVKTQLEDTVKPIHGAEVSGARAEKEPERVEEKIEDGQSPRTVRDYSGYRIAVDSPEAKEQVVQALKQRFEVPNEQDEFNKGNNETGFHGHTLQVREPGSPVSHEVQVLPREVAESADSRHALYEKAREGDKDAAAQMKAANEADWEKFQARNTERKGVAENKPEQPAGAAEAPPAYKHGNTQANIPDDSPAAKALNTFRSAIPQEDLAADGKDVGAGGNHVTVRYGIKGDDTEGIRKFIESQPPFTAKLGKTDVFPPSEHSDGAAVVNAAIAAPEFARLNAEIEKHGDFAESNFKDYKPHATVAYIRPEVAEKYKGRGDMEGEEFPVRSITISDRKGNQTEVPLKGQAAMPASASSLADKTRPWSTESVTAPEGDQARESASQSSRLPAEVTRSIEPSSVKEGGTKGLGSIEPSSKKMIQQPPGDHKTQMEQAKTAVPEFQRILDDLGREFHAEHTPVNLKSEPRILEKLGNGKRPPETISDYIRARMSFDTVPELRRAVKEIESRYGAHQVEDFIDEPKNGAYRAVHLQIHLPNGQSGELQLVPREIYHAQEDAHKDYEVARSADASPEEKRAAIAGIQQKLGSAWDKFRARTGEQEKVLKPGAVGAFPAADLKFDPRRFQYKLNTDAGGTTNLLKGQKFNPDLAGVISVWRDPADGQVYVVNGHHRAQLAKANGVPSLDVRMLKADTAEQARTIGALQNIAEGRGTAIDAAKFFRDTGLTRDDLSHKGISLGEATAANGMALSRLDQPLFDKVVNGQMRLGRAIAIGDATDVPAQQDAILKLIQRAEMKGRRVSDDTVEELARMVKGAGEHAETQQSLFGAVEMRRNLALEKAEVSSYIREQIGKEKRLFQSVADENKAGKLAVAGNKIEASKNAAIAQSAAQAQELYDRLSTRSGAVDEVLNRAAKELADAKENPNAIKSRAYEDARKAISQTLREGQGSRAERVPGRPEFAKGARVRLKDGQAGTVQYFQPEVNGGPALARVKLDSGEMRKSVQAGDMRPEETEPETHGKQWIGVDLDGTLAKYDGFKGPSVIGEPIPEMVNRVKQWLADGKNVKILTARVSEDPQGVAKKAIEAWTEKNLGRKLEVTDVKDAHMSHLYDDRAVPVERNTGKLLAQPQPEGENAKNETTRPAQPLPAPASGEQPLTADARGPGRGTESVRSGPALPGARPANLGRDLAAAQARPATENISRAKVETTTLKDQGNARVSILNPDAYHAIAKLLTPELPWEGAALEPASASRWIAKIRSFESRLRVLPGMKAAAEAAKTLALDLDKAREPDGSLVVLRPDYTESTVREELAHRWQYKTGLYRSEALLAVTELPALRETVTSLRSAGYPDLDAHDLAAETMAKAMAGDPDWVIPDSARKDLVRSFLESAVDEKGAEVLKDLPPVDPSLDDVVNEVRKNAEAKNAGHGREAGERLGRAGREETRADRGERGSALHPEREGQSAAPKSGRASQQAGTPESKLTLFRRALQKAGRLPGEVPLPGMERDVRAQDESAAEERGRSLTEEMKRPKADISKASGEMERNSPLFAGTEANPQGSLFKRAGETTVTTGNHDTGKSLEETIGDLAAMPRRAMSMEERIDAASEAGLRGIAETKEGIDGAWNKVKAATAASWAAWQRPAPWTDFLQSLGDLRRAEFKAAMDLDGYQKELERVAPAGREREAMTAYSEAKDPQELRRWASQADNLPDKRWANAFKDALNLTDRQKRVADSHRRYYDQQLKILTDAGLLPAGAQRYTMHMFASDPETLAQLRSATDFSELAPNPAFLNRRIYKNYFEAIANGEKPRTMDSGKILGAYHDAFTKTFMTRSFLRSLLYGADEEDGRPLAALQSRAGWTLLDKSYQGEARILKQPKHPEDLSGYQAIPSSQLRNFTWELTDEDRRMLAPGYDKMDPEEQKKLFGPEDPRFPVPNDKVLAMKGDLLIHPKYAGRVKDLVEKSWFDRSDHIVAKALKGIQKAGAIAKSTILSGSLFHQVQLGVHAMEHMVNPFKLPELKTLAKDQTVLDGVGHGLNLISVDPEGVLSDLPGMATYHRYLFRDYIPRLKAQMYKHAFERNLTRFSGDLTRDEIHLLTAKQANAAFGGLDPAFFEKLNRMNNRTWKALEHMALFSPDFTKARAQFVAQAFGKYGKEQRYALLRGALVIYAGARIANAVLNQGDAKWAPADALSIVTPKSWGAMGTKRISLRTVQGDLMGLVNDPIQWSYNRLNPVTLRPTIEFLTGRDNFGRQESKTHFAKDYLKQLTPIPVQKIFTTSDEGIVSSLFTSAGLQTGNYRTPLEKMAHEMRLEGIPDKPESEDKQDENRRNVQMVEKIRQGKASTTDLWNLVNQGKMTAREASAVMDRAQMTELQYDVHHLSLDDALKVYEKADTQERAELRPIIEEKRDRDLKNYTDEAAEKMNQQLEDLGIE